MYIWYIECTHCIDDDIEAEKVKLYDAIGYSQKGKVADYPKEVWYVTGLYYVIIMWFYSFSM